MTCRPLGHLPLLAVAILCLSVPATAVADGTVEGAVVAPDGPVSFAIIGVEGTTYGTQADIEGRYRIEELPAGHYTVAASSMGFRRARVRVEVADGDTVRADFALTPQAIELDGVTVTGSMRRTFVRDSPTKVNVVSPDYLVKIPTANVMEVLENVNGLYQQIDCAVCGTNNIRINGMDGPYTAVLIDGMPIMSSLATVYALNGISPSLIQQVEVIKGPMSTLYGSEAMGGVINIITKSPQTAPGFTLNAFRTSDAEHAVDLGFTRTRGRLSTLVSATGFYNQAFLDENGDDFADVTLNKRGSLFGKAALRDEAGRPQVDLSARWYYEDRLGGTRRYVEDYSEALRGSGEVYGETILTSRVELLGTWHARPERGARLDVAFNHHDQDSFYGDASYQATQSTGFAQFLWPMRLDGAQTLMLGTTLRGQRYDDDTGATGDFDDAGRLLANRPDDRWIPGVLAQHEWILSPSARLQSGLRFDYQEDHGVIPSPSANLKVGFGANTTMRLNAGTGFRIVNLFTEDHAAYTGSRATVILESLDPERSVSGLASLQHIVGLDGNPLTIDLEGFYTYFTNKIEPDYSQPGRIVYANLDGSSTTRGLSLTLNQSLTLLPVTYTLGGTLMDVFVDEDGQRRPLEFAPDYQGVFNATVALPRAVSLDYTVNLTGPMQLPEYDAPFERDPRSNAFAVHNLQLTRDWKLGDGELLQAYVSVENLFSYTQPSPLIDPADPFGPNFDTAYVYGPIHGRCGGVGVRWFVR